jgi:hypothetical protein
LGTGLWGAAVSGFAFLLVVEFALKHFVFFFFLSRILPALMSLCPADTAAGAMVMHQIAINRMSTHWGFHRL